MSPLWREQVHVLVAPTELTLGRFGKGIRPAMIAKTTVPIAKQTSTGLPLWSSSVQALGRVLGTEEWAQGDLALVLSNHFVRYRVVPWQDELRDEQELTAYAEQVLRQAYGGVASAEWSVDVSIDRVGSPCVASAVDTALIEALRTLAGQQGRRLMSVRPLLMEAFNLARGWLTGGCYWVVIVEEGLICAALIGRGRWVVVRTARFHGDWPSELVAMLEREQYLVEEAEAAQTVLLHVINGTYQELPANHWTVRPVHPAGSHHTTTSVLSCAL